MLWSSMDIGKEALMENQNLREREREREREIFNILE
jgi:hypothetical protein